MLHVFKCFCILLGKNNTDTGVVNAVRMHWCKPSPRAGAAGGGDVRGVQFAGGSKHAVGVCDDGNKPGERMTVQVGRRTEAISEEFNSQRWEQNRVELSHIRGVQLSHFMIPMTPANSVVTN